MWRWALIVYGVMGVWTFLTYAWDKRAAVRGRRRVRESSLHALALLGGIVGAIAGQALLRHKTLKRRFQAVTWLIAALHAAAWIAWLRLGRS